MAQCQRTFHYNLDHLISIVEAVSDDHAHFDTPLTFPIFWRPRQTPCLKLSMTANFPDSVSRVVKETLQRLRREILLARPRPVGPLHKLRLEEC
jgi:hypothetical protein